MTIYLCLSTITLARFPLNFKNEIPQYPQNASMIIIITIRIIRELIVVVVSGMQL